MSFWNFVGESLDLGQTLGKNKSFGLISKNSFNCLVYKIIFNLDYGLAVAKKLKKEKLRNQEKIGYKVWIYI